MDPLESQFKEAMLRLGLNTGVKLQTSAQKEELQALSEQMYERLRPSIEDRFHLERVLDSLLRTATKMPLEVHWRKALYATRVAKPPIPRLALSQNSYEGNPRDFLYGVMKNRPQNEREEKILNGAIRLYGEKELWAAYEIWYETGKDPLAGKIPRAIATKNTKREHEADTTPGPTDLWGNPIPK